MSVICRQFVQNSWRKDLCSNCFKSEEEHTGRPPFTSVSRLGALDSLDSVGRRYTSQTRPYSSSISELISRSSSGGSSLTLKSTALLRGLQTTPPAAEPRTMVRLDLTSETSTSDNLESTTDSPLMSSKLVQLADSPGAGDTSLTSMTSSSDSPDRGDGGTTSVNSAINRTLVTSSAISGRLVSILVKEGRARSRQKATLVFCDEPEVIGYGGEPVESDDDMDGTGDIENEQADFSDVLTPEERSLLNLTKRNTDFNSVNSNLLGTGRTLLDWVDENDQTTERSALTGRHKKFTPVVSIAPFSASRGPGGVKVNLVAPMKNGELVTENRSRVEMVEKRTTVEQSTSSAKMAEKITRLDDLIDDKPKKTTSVEITAEVANSNNSVITETVSITEFSEPKVDGKSQKAGSPPQVETRLSFVIGGKRDQKDKQPDRSAAEVPVPKSRVEEPGKSKLGTVEEAAKDLQAAEVKNDASVRKTVPAASDTRASYDKTTTTVRSSLKEPESPPVSERVTKQEKPLDSAKRSLHSSALQRLIEADVVNQSPGGSQEPVSNGDSSRGSKEAEDHSVSKVHFIKSRFAEKSGSSQSPVQSRIKTTTSEPHKLNSVASSGLTRSSSPKSSESYVEEKKATTELLKPSPRASFLHSLTSSQPEDEEILTSETVPKLEVSEPHSVASPTVSEQTKVTKDQETSNKIEKTETDIPGHRSEIRSTRNEAAIKSASKPSGVTHKPPILREKPKIATKPTKLQHRLSRTTSNDSDSDKQAPITGSERLSASKDITSCESSAKELSPETSSSHEDSAEPESISSSSVCVEVKSPVLDPAARLTKLVESAKKSEDEPKEKSHLTISLPPPTPPARKDSMTRKERAMRRERELEKQREELEKLRKDEQDEENEVKRGESHKDRPAPQPPVHRELERTISSEFESNRAAIANLLSFGHRGSATKRQAPKVPASTDKADESSQDDCQAEASTPETETASEEAESSTKGSLASNSEFADSHSRKPSESESKDSTAFKAEVSSTSSEDTHKTDLDKPPSHPPPPPPPQESSKESTPAPEETAPRPDNSAKFTKKDDANPYASTAIFERRPSFKPSDDDEEDDLPPSASMRSSSVSPKSRKRSTNMVSFDPGVDYYSRETAVLKPRSQSVPRSGQLMEGLMTDDEFKKKIYGMGSTSVFTPNAASTASGGGGGGERRSRRDEPKRRGKFSLKKFLKFGKDDKKKDKDRVYGEFRSKPEIIHPLDLAPSGKVEVIVRTEEEKRRDEAERERKKALLIAEGTKVYDSPSFSKVQPAATSKPAERTSPTSPTTPTGLTGTSWQHGALGFNSEGRPKPPPPPRRTSSIDQSELVTTGQQQQQQSTPPTRPPPPNPDLISRSRDGSGRSRDTEYANLGVNRAGLTPRKPDRGGSVRGQESPKLHLAAEQRPPADGSDVTAARSFQQLPDQSVISSAPEEKADGRSSADKSDERGESELPRQRPARVSLRKQTSIVSANLEENYDAVTSHNHEALVQVLEQVTLHRPPPAALRHLEHNPALAFTHFKVLPESHVTTGRRAFLQALHRQQTVLLMLSSEPAATPAASVQPVAQFRDLVQGHLLPKASTGTYTSAMQATVWVFPPVSVQPFWEMVSSREPVTSEEQEHDLCFLLLQTVHHLMSLQARGQQFVDETLCELVCTRPLETSDGDKQSRLVAVYGNYGGRQKLTGCQAALAVMLRLLGVPDALERVREGRGVSVPDVPSQNAFELLASLLLREDGAALRRVRGVLEYLLWGPGQTEPAQEEAMQRWLHLERATVLNNLIRTQKLWSVQLTVLEEFRLIFLVNTDAAALKDASALLDI